MTLPLWGDRAPTGPIPEIRILQLLATRRPKYREGWRTPWETRRSALYRVLPHARPALRRRVEREIRAMLAERDASYDRRRRAADEDWKAALQCDLRHPLVRGLDKGETRRRGVCFLDARPLPPRRQFWCSDACVDLWTRNHEWSAASFAALSRDGRTCVRCSAAAREVNHKTPRRGRGYHQGCHNHLSELESLCRSCHQAETNRQRAEAVA